MHDPLFCLQKNAFLQKTGIGRYGTLSDVISQNCCHRSSFQINSVLRRTYGSKKQLKSKAVLMKSHESLTQEETLMKHL